MHLTWSPALLYISFVVSLYQHLLPQLFLLPRHAHSHGSMWVNSITGIISHRLVSVSNIQKSLCPKFPLPAHHGRRAQQIAPFLQPSCCKHLASVFEAVTQSQEEDFTLAKWFSAASFLSLSKSVHCFTFFLHWSDWNSTWLTPPRASLSCSTFPRHWSASILISVMKTEMLSIPNHQPLLETLSSAFHYNPPQLWINTLFNPGTLTISSGYVGRSLEFFFKL